MVLNTISWTPISNNTIRHRTDRFTEGNHWIAQEKNECESEHVWFARCFEVEIVSFYAKAIQYSYAVSVESILTQSVLCISFIFMCDRISKHILEQLSEFSFWSIVFTCDLSKLLSSDNDSIWIILFQSAKYSTPVLDQRGINITFSPYY